MSTAEGGRRIPPLLTGDITQMPCLHATCQVEKVQVPGPQGQVNTFGPHSEVETSGPKSQAKASKPVKPGCSFRAT